MSRKLLAKTALLGRESQSGNIYKEIAKTVFWQRESIEVDHHCNDKRSVLD